MENGGDKKICCSLCLLERNIAQSASRGRRLLRCVSCTDEQTEFLLGKQLNKMTSAARQVDSNIRDVFQL